VTRELTRFAALKNSHTLFFKEEIVMLISYTYNEECFIYLIARYFLLIYIL